MVFNSRHIHSRLFRRTKTHSVMWSTARGGTHMAEENVLLTGRNLNQRYIARWTRNVVYGMSVNLHENAASLECQSRALDVGVALRRILESQQNVNRLGRPKISLFVSFFVTKHYLGNLAGLG